MKILEHGRRLAAAAAVVASACSLATEPVPRIRDSFVLQSLGGDALPTLEHVNGICGIIVVADTLILFEDGTGVQRTARDVPSYKGAVDPLTCEPAASSPKERRQDLSEFSYQLDGTVITIDYPCNDTPNAACLPPWAHAGTLTDEGLVVDVSHSVRTPLVYARLAGLTQP